MKRCCHTHFVVLSLALSAVGVLGAAVTTTIPFAVLGAAEAVGAAATELAILGLSIEATTIEGAVNTDNSATQSARSAPGNVCISNNTLLTAQRPISAWRIWVAGPSSSPPLLLF
jgi:hypothetical protein